jgi:hypothetical protein
LIHLNAKLAAWVSVPGVDMPLETIIRVSRELRARARRAQPETRGIVTLSKELCKQSAGRVATARRLREPVSARDLFNVTQQAE